VEIGIEVYVTQSCGIGGRLRQLPEDFRVEEVLTNGSKAQVESSAIQQIEGRGRYLVCVLVKRNCDTLIAIHTIAKKLDVDEERIEIAGIKDARALTAQHVSIGRMLPDQVAQLKLNNIRLCPLHFSNGKIHSNLLFGNDFSIIVRAINHASSEIVGRMEGVRKELLGLGGCPNFFGHQRFGTTRPITHLVGKHMLHGEWEKAAVTFLTEPSPYEHPESRRARELLWKTQNYEEALHYFPFRLIYERQMLSHLAKQSRDYIGTFHRLPKKLRQLFIQAYQSYLFNKFLSQRIQRGLPLKKARGREFKLKIDGEEYVALPLIGYNQSVSTGEQGEIEKRTLEKEDVTPQNFKISMMPEISSSGGLRTALTPLIGLKIEKPIKDEFNPTRKMVQVSFTLKKGSYATTILREFMKPQNPIRAGF